MTTGISRDPASHGRLAPGARGQATAGLDDSEREGVQRAVTVMNALYGAPARVRVLAADLVAHWESRSEQMRKFIGGLGKGIIVCATRQICADLYEQIIGLKPDWHHDDIDKGKIKVVYTGGPDDPAPIRKHVRRPMAGKYPPMRTAASSSLPP